MAALDEGLELTEEQKETLETLKKIRDQAGVYESRFAKVALVKAQRQSERDSAQAERDELHAEVEKLKQHVTALTNRKAKLSARTQLTGRQANTQQQLAVARDTAALAHAIQALQEQLRPHKANLESLLRHRNSELEEQHRYVQQQQQLVALCSEAGAGEELAQEQTFVENQIAEAAAELKEAEAAYVAFVSTKFGARGASVELGIASNVVFEDARLNLAALEGRLKLRLQEA